MKKIFIFSTFFVLAFVATGCSLLNKKEQNEATPQIHVVAIPDQAPQETPQVTPGTEEVIVSPSDESELRNASYENFKNRTMGLLTSETDPYAIDLSTLFSLAGLSYRVENSAIIAETSYQGEGKVLINIRFSGENNIINGDTIYRGLRADGDWGEVVEHDSATDCIFDALVDNQRFLIGVDELDYLWRQVRILTAPADKIDEINAEVDAELASYMESPSE